MSNEVSTSSAALKLHERWGVLLRRGFVAYPISLLMLGPQLGLEPLDVVILLHLIRLWIDERPFPSQATLAKNIGVHVRTVRRRLRALRGKGYLETTRKKTAKGNEVHRYDLRPLIRLAGYAAINAGLDRPAVRPS